jgi:dipeptidyl aminopeptidase/acylaminoacyl peptidase
MSWMGGWFDPELEDLFRDDPDLRETAQQIRAARPDVEADPRFQNRLRAQLVAEAARGRGPLGIRRGWRLGPSHAAWGGAILGVALIGATVLTFISGSPADRTITAISDVSAQPELNPDHVITVAFNQPMDEVTVEKGVRIQPATKVAYSWHDNTLLISPVYHLAGNTAYTVTIKQDYIKATSGASASAPLVIPFATAPTPPPAVGVATPPSLAPSVVGSNVTGGSLLFAPDGSVVSTEGLAPQAPTFAPVATATPSSTTSPSPSASASPSATPTVSSSPAPGGVVEFPATGSPAQLGPAATAAAFSPNGSYLATAVDDGNGGSKIVVSLSDGTQRLRLTDSTVPVTALTWSSNDRIVYTTGSAVYSVDLSRTTQTLYTQISGASITALDPGGSYAYVAPVSGTGGDLVNITTGTAQQLQGAVADVAFSGDGSTVAWVDEASSQARLFTEAVGQNAPASVSVLNPSAQLADVTLDIDGDEVAYLATASGSAPQLVVAQLPSGTPLAVGSPASASSIAVSPGGNQVAFISNTGAGPVVEEASVPGATAARVGAQIPAAANSTLHAFVEAQVRDDLATLATLSAPGVNAEASTPSTLSREYVISTYLTPQGVVSANVELIVDPTTGHASAEVASETLSLVRMSPGNGYLVNSILSTPLHDESSGPHVVQVSSSTASGVTTLQVSFDSDLNPFTVAGAFTVLSASGAPLSSTASYDADSRTATVILDSESTGVLTLEIATTLGDVDGQTLARTFQTTVGASS